MRSSTSSTRRWPPSTSLPISPCHHGARVDLAKYGVRTGRVRSGTAVNYGFDPNATKAEPWGRLWEWVSVLSLAVFSAIRRNTTRRPIFSNKPIRWSLSTRALPTSHPGRVRAPQTQTPSTAVPFSTMTTPWQCSNTTTLRVLLSLGPVVTLLPVVTDRPTRYPRNHGCPLQDGTGTIGDNIKGRAASKSYDWHQHSLIVLQPLKRTFPRKH